MTLIEKFGERLNLLTDRERLYLSMMWPKSGVLYISSKPGVAKSSIARSIAKKIGFKYFDLRLSMIDETDIGLYPNISNVEIDSTMSETGKKTIKCLDFVVPRWAVEANNSPTIIHFEELNRASLQVRNAALQILLERQIGVDFYFNENVLFISSGNLGDEDNTDVDEFDAALNNRLIHVDHTLDVNEWVDNYANENVHKTIVQFIKDYPEYLYKTPGESDRAYATPRSWTFLSDYIKGNFGLESDPKEFLPLISKISDSYVGSSSSKFIKYCQENIDLNINDIIDRFDEIKNKLAKYNRDKNSELINSLKEISLLELTDLQLENVIKFLKQVSEDECVGYLVDILDENDNSYAIDSRIQYFFSNFPDLLDAIESNTL